MMDKRLHMLAMLLLVVGGVNWGLVGAYDIDIIKKVVKNKMMQRVIYITVGIVALYMASKRNTWLPFLGKTVVPCNLLNKKEPEGTDHKIVLNVGKGKKVIYWGAEEKEGEGEVEEVWKAYGELENSGVVEADEEGNVELKFRYPQKYYVNKLLRKKELESHIHYRVCEDGMMLGEVKTIKV